MYYECPQDQGTLKNNCGLHAIATVMMLIHGQDPSRFRVKRNMRQQQYNMLNTSPPQMELFPSCKRIELLPVDEDLDSNNV